MSARERALAFDAGAEAARQGKPRSSCSYTKQNDRDSFEAGHDSVTRSLGKVPSPAALEHVSRTSAVDVAAEEEAEKAADDDARLAELFEGAR